MGFFKRFGRTPTPEAPDEKTLQLMLLQGGVQEEKAVKVLFGPLRDAVFAWICQRGGDHIQADDIFQTAMYVLLTYVREGKIDKLGRPRAFVFQVCKNQWVSECRRQGKTVGMQEHFDPEDPAQESYVGQLFNDEMNRKEIHRELGQLKGKCREHLLLYYYENWSNADIAREFDSTENSVKSSRSQCIRKLKTRIRECPRLLHLFQSFTFSVRN